MLRDCGNSGCFCIEWIPAQLNRLQNELMVINDIYIDLAKLVKPEAMHRKTDTEPQHEPYICVKRLAQISHQNRHKGEIDECITDRIGITIHRS